MLAFSRSHRVVLACMAALLFTAACAPPPAAAPGSGTRTGRVPVDGGELAFEMAGAGSTVVFVHGGLVDRRLWDDQFRELARDHQVIRYDLRGFGESTAPRGAFSHVDDLHAVLEHLGVRRATIVGLSLGGMVSTDYALLHPDRVEGLVLVASALRGYRSPPDEAARDTGAAPRAWASIRRLGMADSVAVVNLMMDSTTMAPYPPAARARMRTMLLKNVRGLMTIDPATVRWPAWVTVDRLAEIRAPTLVIVGDHDTAALLGMANLLAARIPDASLATIARGSHHPNLDDPDGFTRHLRRFLGR